MQRYMGFSSRGMLHGKVAWKIAQRCCKAYAWGCCMEDWTVALKNILHGALLKGPKHGDAARKCCCLVALQSVLHGVCFRRCCMAYHLQFCRAHCIAHCTLHRAVHWASPSVWHNAVAKDIPRGVAANNAQSLHRMWDIPWGCGTEHCVGNPTGK